MPDPASHHPAMFTVKGTTLPRLWWLKPWSTARTLAVTVEALKAYADRADLALKAAQDSREHWINKHDRAYAVAMHNERVIREMEERSRG
jgi:hypothetical protein